MCCSLFILLTEEPHPQMVHLQTDIWACICCTAGVTVQFVTGTAEDLPGCSHPTCGLFVKDLSTGVHGLALGDLGQAA